MASSYTTRTFDFSDGLTYAAQDLRLLIGALLSDLGGPSSNALGVGSGVRNGTGNPMQVAVSSGLSVTVAPGYAFVQGSAAANTGTYMVTLDATPTLTCATADPSNPRIDSLCVTVTDLGTSSSTAVVQIVTGSPAGSPSPPVLPSNSLLLCNITVPAAAASLTSGNLSDQRVFMAAAGGIKKFSATSPATGDVADYAHNTNTGRLVVCSGSGVETPKTVTFAPSIAPSAASTGVSGSSSALVTSTVVTTDGSTNVRLTASWSEIVSSGTSAGNNCVVGLYRGFTLVKSFTMVAQVSNGAIQGGGVTVIDPTPAAGTYTYKLELAAGGIGSASFTLMQGDLAAEAVPG